MRKKYSHFRKVHGRKQLVAAALACLFLVATTFALMDSPNQKIHDFFRTSFTHQPEKLTELYFTNVTSLPKTYKAATVVPLDFTIHNLEHADLTYHYQLVVLDAHGTVLQSNPIQTTVVANGQTVQFHANFRPVASTTRQEVIIALTDQQQSIHLWLEPVATGGTL